MSKLSTAYARISSTLWEIAFFLMLIWTAAMVAPQHLAGESVMIVMLSMTITIRLLILIVNYALRWMLNLFSQRTITAQKP